MISFNFSFVVFRFKNKHNFVIVLLLLVAEAHYTRTKWCAALCVFFYTIQSTTLYSYEYKNWQNALGIVYTWPCVYIFYKKKLFICFILSIRCLSGVRDCDCNNVWLFLFAFLFCCCFFILLERKYHLPILVFFFSYTRIVYSLWRSLDLPFA